MLQTRESNLHLKTSHRKKVSSNALIVWALHREQPQGFNELAKKAGSRSTLYRNLPMLRKRGIVKIVKDGGSLRQSLFALSDYAPLKEKVREGLKEFKEEGYVAVSLVDLANRVGNPPEEIREHAYREAKKLGLRIGDSKQINISMA